MSTSREQTIAKMSPDLKESIAVTIAAIRKVHAISEVEEKLLLSTFALCYQMGRCDVLDEVEKGPGFARHENPSTR